MLFRKKENAPQKGATYMTFHRGTMLGMKMAEVPEKLVILEGGVYMPGPAPTGATRSRGVATDRHGSQA